MGRNAIDLSTGHTLLKIGMREGVYSSLKVARKKASAP